MTWMNLENALPSKRGQTQAVVTCMYVYMRSQKSHSCRDREISGATGSMGVGQGWLLGQVSSRGTKMFYSQPVATVARPMNLLKPENRQLEAGEACADDDRADKKTRHELAAVY